MHGGSSAIFGQTNTDDSSLPVLKISGGTLYVNADEEGLDSNGDLIVEGGNIIVDGSTTKGEKIISITPAYSAIRMT